MSRPCYQEHMSLQEDTMLLDNNLNVSSNQNPSTEISSASTTSTLQSKSSKGVAPPREESQRPVYREHILLQEDIMVLNNNISNGSSNQRVLNDCKCRMNSICNCPENNVQVSSEHMLLQENMSRPVYREHILLGTH